MAVPGTSRRPESGAVAVEFALVLPLLILMVFGTIQYGSYFWARSSASAAVREGARRVSVGDYAACSDLQSFLLAEVGPARAGSGVSTKRSFKDPTTKLNSSPGKVGDIMTITVSFTALDIGFVPLPASGVVTANAVSRLESVKSPPPGAC